VRAPVRSHLFRQVVDADLIVARHGFQLDHAQGGTERLP
jgi:hypothetical protein